MKDDLSVGGTLSEFARCSHCRKPFKPALQPVMLDRTDADALHSEMMTHLLEEREKKPPRQPDEDVFEYLWRVNAEIIFAPPPDLIAKILPMLKPIKSNTR